MLINSNKFLVLGVSKSGFSASSYLLSKGAICYVFEEKTLIAPINPPRESDPVSPIKTFALLVLNIKNPSIPPIKQNDNKTSF